MYYVLCLMLWLIFRKLLLKKYMHLSIFFKLYLVMYGLYLLAKKKKKKKTDPIFHLRFLSLMSLKAFLRCEKPGFSYPKTTPPLIPTPQLAGR